MFIGIFLLFLTDKVPLKHMNTKNAQITRVFYYHSDHLGSAAYLTNDAGQVSQTLNYLPYGEDWVDLQFSLDYRLGQYTFNGKEKDSESGFHYYGARYYWSELLTGWLSVDPMSDKYPGISPYAYCAWNPVKLIDPDGREAVDDWVKNKKTGQYEWNDNATSPNNTPNGYSYIGNDDALLNDLNIKTDYETQEDCASGYYPDRGSNYVGFTRSRNCNDAMIKVSVRAKYDKKNIYL